MSTSTASSTATSSSGSSWRSRLSIGSTFSSSTGNSDAAPSSASSMSSRSRTRRTEPRSFPARLDPTRPVPAPSSELSSPVEMKVEPSFTPTDDISVASPILFPDDKSQSQSGEPYMFCTYCAESKLQKTFKAKSDWKKHEMRMHETGEDWQCVVLGCSRIFDRQKDFIKHHQRYHSGRPLPSLTDIGITLLPRRVFGCGFDKCKEVSIGWDERCDHVAKHMKNGATYDQWKYSNVIRNLIRQEALHDTWKELIGCLDERLRESRSQISWCPDNSRILRQKLQCCDLRPSREEVLITALSLRSDIPLDPVHQQLPPGFVTPSRDSVPNVDKLSREQRMHVLIGNSNIEITRTRLAAINAALLRVSSNLPQLPDYECESSSFAEPQSPAGDETNCRISYMDVDPGDYLHVAQPAIPEIPLVSHQPAMHVPHAHSAVLDNTPQSYVQSNDFADPAKTSANPIGSFYPSYFDAAPQFEDSQYYDRQVFDRPSSFGQMISKPLSKIGNRLGNSRSNSTNSRPSSHLSHEMGPEFALQNPVAAMGMRHPHQHPHQHMQQQHQHQQNQHQHQHHHQQQQHILSQTPQSYRHSTQMQDTLHLYTSQG